MLPLMNLVGSTEVALLISKATSSLVEEARILAAFNLIFEVYYLICIKCSLPLHLYQMFFNFAFEECRKATGLDNTGVTTPPFTPVTELDLGVFFHQIVS